VEFLRHPDYHLPEVPVERLSGEIERVLLDVRPEVVITFGPDGMTSHHDHIRVGAAATLAFDRARQEAHPGELARLYHAVLARSDVDRFYAGVRAGGHEYGEEGQLFDVTGVPDERIAVRVDTTPVRDRKVEGIRAHRTQRGEYERFPESLRWLVLDTECFVQARPVLERTDGLRSDPFVDLPGGAAIRALDAEPCSEED